MLRNLTSVQAVPFVLLLLKHQLPFLALYSGCRPIMKDIGNHASRPRFWFRRHGCLLLLPWSMGDTTFFCRVHINDTGDEPGGLVPCSRGTMWMEATILMNKNTLTVEEHINRLMHRLRSYIPRESNSCSVSCTVGCLRVLYCPHFLS